MKKLILTLSAVSLAAVLTGCKANTDKISTTAQPSASASPTVTTVLPDSGMPDHIDGLTDGMDAQNATDGVLPSMTVMPETAGVTSMDKAKRVVEQIEDELERLSEVEDAEVILAGNKAAVALSFDSQYKAGLDDRLRGIVKERIASVVSGISTIAVTTDDTIRSTLESLGEKLEDMSDLNALESDLDAVIKKINGVSA